MKVLSKLGTYLSKPQTSAAFLKAKRKKNAVSILIDTNIRVLLYI